MNNSELIGILRSKGIDERIIAAVAGVRREKFIPEELAPYAYEDILLPIEQGSTISQPSTIAFVLELLDPRQDQKVLEIGSGSGYVLALLMEIIKKGKVYGIEINKKLAAKSRQVLSNYSDVLVINKNGLEGLPEYEPYDRILISASCPDKELPYFLLDQLKDPGILVCPVKDTLYQMKKENNQITEKEIHGYRFVPLLKSEIVS